MIRDVQGFRRRLKKINKIDDKQKADLLKTQLNEHIEKSMSIVKERQTQIPNITYPDDLPIAQKSELIKQTISENQVTILCGETGSGKTTQLPKMCLDIGLGIRGKVAHTQPRRLAARAVSQRIAEELKTEPGCEVGFKVRFSDQSNDKSYIKLMTDGILLAECNHDPYLNEYDTVIIDEAHERSLNIDFLIGYLKRLIRKRKDLKIIITSATIDPERFSRHFSNAPIINVSGRTYPVEVRYRPYQDLESDNKKDLQQGIIDAINELSKIDRGDILVFLSGERDIRETTDALAKEKGNRSFDNTEVLPLLARLSNVEQNRIFQPSSKRRIVLATNVAETSLTVPGIKYVIDSGVARISRYSWRSKIQRLPIEKISQASANQRKGRCGRVSSGICIRLYDEEDFNQRAEFTEPEIQRTNLASVILQMENLRLGHIDDFPFVEPPENRLINDGYKLLFELGAINNEQKITKVGKKIAHFPIDPKLARILLEADKEKSLAEVLIVVSALATQDPRERPLDKQQAADEKHSAFVDKSSDFIFYLNLWNAYHAEKENASNNQLRKWCKKNYISWMRMREWIDTYGQIKRMLLNQKYNINKIAGNYDQIHRSLLIGLLANIGFKDEGKEYFAARSKKFFIFPGSALFKTTPKWIMASEVVETSRVYARTNAKIDVTWLESKANHLLKRHYKNPHWEKKRSQVIAHEQSSLYGLIISADKKINYARINPLEAKEIFIHCALIEGDFDCKAAFFQHNRKLVKELASLEAKSRRHDVIVDDDVLYDFYSQQLPDDINSGGTLDKWLRQDKSNGNSLFLTNEVLMRSDATIVSNDLFPDYLAMSEDKTGSRFPLEYHFDPTNHCDGITLVTPLAGVNAINPQRCEWLIPGLLKEKIVALIKSLPKVLRKNFVPAPNFAEACCEALKPSETALCAALANHLKKMTGVQIPYDAWNISDIPQYLLMNFRVINLDGDIIEEGRDLQNIKGSLSNSSDLSLISATPQDDNEEMDRAQGTEYGRDDVTVAALDDLEEMIEIDVQGVLIKAYPALVQHGKQINLRALETRQKAQVETHKAIRQLFKNKLIDQIKHLKRSLPDIQNLCLKYKDFGHCEDLKNDIINNAVDDVFLYESVNTEAEFEERLQKGKSELYDAAERCRQLLNQILDKYRLLKKMMQKPELSQLDTITDIQTQLHHLFADDFITTIDAEWLQQYPRYLLAIEKRFEKSKTNATRDRQLRQDFSRLWDEFIKRKTLLAKQHVESEQLNHYRWMLEEYRISLFAQEIKTKFPVSEKRLKKYWNTLSDV